MENQDTPATTAPASPALGVAVGSACRHECTQGRKLQTGSWCVKCGLKIYAVDPRECQHCVHFKNMGELQVPICTHHMMGVTRTMHVTYELAKGTCFSPNNTGQPRAKRVGL